MILTETGLVDINLFFYNSSTKLNDVIESIIDQTWKSWRLALIDNGSTDGSMLIAESWASRDERITVKRLTKNLGIIGGLQVAFREGNAPFVMPKTSDDILERYFIERIMDVLLTHTGYAMCHSGAANVNRHSGYEEEVPTSYYLHAAAEDSPIQRAAHVMQTYTFAPAFWGIYRRQFVDLCLPPLPLPRSDHAFLAELSLYGGITHVPEVLFLRDGGPKDIPSAALAGDISVIRSGSEDDLFIDCLVYLPSLAGVWAHIETFSLARIDINTRLALMRKAKQIFQERWGPIIKKETIIFREHVVPRLQETITNLYISGDAAASVILSLNLEKALKIIEWFDLDV